MKKLENILADNPAVQSEIQVLLIEDNPADARLFKEYLIDEPAQAYTLTHVETIADALEDGPRSVDDLAQATGTHAGALNRALRLLSAHGVFHSTWKPSGVRSACQVTSPPSP